MRSVPLEGDIFFGIFWCVVFLLLLAVMLFCGGRGRSRSRTRLPVSVEFMAEQSAAEMRLLSVGSCELSGRDVGNYVQRTTV